MRCDRRCCSLGMTGPRTITTLRSKTSRVAARPAPAPGGRGGDRGAARAGGGPPAGRRRGQPGAGRDRARPRPLSVLTGRRLGHQPGLQAAGAAPLGALSRWHRRGVVGSIISMGTGAAGSPRSPPRPRRSETVRAGPAVGRGHHRAPVRRTVTLRAPHPGSADHDVPRAVGTDAAGTRLTGEQARARVRVRVEGVVQGVGYRPFVHALAAELGVAGFVGNDVDGVFAEAEGASGAVGEFVTALRERAPALAVVERVTADAMPPTGDGGFVIAPSTTGGRRRTLISADTATCVDCLRELNDPADRRFRYPFINCTNCGPRFTIVTDVPYDRAATTMAPYPLCPACAREYADPGDRRFHAQPVCCPDCGPALVLTDAAGAPVAGDPVAAAAAELRSGRILAIKGLGGYHLAVDAVAEPAVATLRARKHREERPLAVMAADLEAARTIAGVGEVAASLLTGRRRRGIS